MGVGILHHFSDSIIKIKQKSLFAQHSNIRLQKANERLQMELNNSNEHLNKHEQLMYIVNDIATQLMNTCSNDFDNTMLKCLNELADGINADRAYLFKNKSVDGNNGITPISQWSRSPIIYDDYIPYSQFGDWEKSLENDAWINYHVNTMPGSQRKLFRKCGVQSILIIPIHIGEEFWGVIYFANAEQVRLPSEVEVRTVQSGAILIVMALLRNIAMDEQQNAVKLVQESSHSKTMFLANMSHEIRTPMNVILGCADKIRKDPSQTNEYLNQIEDSSKHLLTIIGNVLEMSNIEFGELKLKPTPFYLHETMNEVFQTYKQSADEKNQNINLECCTCPQIKGDEGKLKQVLMHIIMNAIKYTPEGGSININATVMGRAEEVLYTRIYIEDSGPGIAEDSIARIFNVFEQSDNKLSRLYEGAGLGLSIAQGIIKKMGGQIKLESKLGQGSKFIIDLPFKLMETSLEFKEAKPISEDKIDISKFKGHTILLVEDNEINRMVCASMLEAADIMTEEAENGKIAVEMIKNTPDKYDAVLMDIQMPVMDGYEATREIRALDIPQVKNLPIIAVTANTFEKDIQKCLEAGMNDHIGKPVEAEILYGKLSQYKPASNM